MIAAFTGLLLLIVAAAYLAGPAWLALSSALVPVWLRAVLVLLTVLACVRPAWSPAVLLGTVPLLPVWPTIVPALPPALVHLVVLSQAIPWLIRRAVGRVHLTRCSMTPGWALFVAVAAVSVCVGLTPARWRGAEAAHVWRNITAQVPGYIFVSHATSDGRALPMLLGLFDGLLCCFTVSGSPTRATRPGTLRAAAVAAVASALFGMVQASNGLGLQHAWQIFDAGIVRINATYADPNALAAFYALIGPVLIGLALAAARWRRAAWGAAALIVMVAMVMTAGRAGLASLALGCAVLAWLGLRRELDAVDPSRLVRRYARPVVRGGAVAAVVVLVAVVTVGTTLNMRHEQQTSYLHTWLYTLNLRQSPDAIAKGRLAVWRIVMTMVREAPLTGIGLGNSVNEFERYRGQLGIASLPSDARLSAHNTYLLVTSELGVIGLTAWLLMMFAVLHGIRAPGNLPFRDPAGWPVLGLAAGLAGYAFTMLTGDRILLREDIVVGTTCAAIASLGAGPLPRPWRVLSWLTLAVVLASWPVRATSRPLVPVSLPEREGLHDDQIGVRGDTYRWSTGYAVIYLAADVVDVQLPVRNLSPGRQQIDIFVDGRHADRRQLEPGPWVTLSYRLPPAPRSGWHRLALQVTPTWQAPGDPRVLGVVVGEWTEER
ncbi:MAG: O-antigen ligase family protein [Luteitalea sp.]